LRFRNIFIGHFRYDFFRLHFWVWYRDLLGTVLHNLLGFWLRRWFSGFLSFWGWLWSQYRLSWLLGFLWSCFSWWLELFSSSWLLGFGLIFNRGFLGWCLWLFFLGLRGRRRYRLFVLLGFFGCLF
jgi:hypothetical protein